MPSSKLLPRYTLIALVIVVVLAISNRALLFQLLDPAGKQERQQEQALRALGSSDTALSSAQARELFERYTAGEYAAGTALVHQDQKNGLPQDFTEQLEALLADRSADTLKAAYLIERMALHRSFGRKVEQGLAGAVRTPRGGIAIQPIKALGNIGAHRPLTEPTLTLLLEIALRRSSAERVALAALEKTAQSHGLPDWALDRLQEIAETRPGPVRSDAIGLMAAAGGRERAMSIANKAGNAPASRDAIALTLEGTDLTQLNQVLRDTTLRPEIRTGALTQIVKHRDESTRVGKALAYAFTSDDDALRLKAFSTFSEWGRHHSRYIDVDWPDVCARAFADDNEAIRHQAASSFRFIPFSDLDARDQFLLMMLDGDTRQQLAALRAVSSSRKIPETVRHAAVGLAESSDANVAQVANMLSERYRPKEPFEGLGSWLAGAVFWFLLILPAFTALGFETYFVAHLLRKISNGENPVGAALVSVVWFVLSAALGAILFVGLLGLGHGGGLDSEIYLVLLVMNAVFAGMAMLLRLFIQDRHSPDL